jgi:DNA-binding PadR family transcriptional regulator
MGQRGFGRQWAQHVDQQWQQHGRRGGWGGPPWGGWGPSGFGRLGNPGPPPWVAGLFGLAQGDRQRGPRVRRGDVRAAILDVVRTAKWNGDEINGYQVIQQIAERSNGAWRPSPGSVYPTIQQLEDEGLVETTDSNGRRGLRLTAAGEEYVADHADELAAVWTPFEEPDRDETAGFADVRPEIGQVMGAIWQIVTTGSDQQRRAALDILVETRRKLYGLLADGDPEQTEDS